MSAIYIVLPLALLVVVVALIVFVRAVRTGQFDDLDTPGARILHDDEPAEPSGPSPDPDRGERRSV